MEHLEVERGKWIQIKKEELDEMKRELLFLQCLREYGVDNWQGYDEAVIMYHEEYLDE